MRSAFKHAATMAALFAATSCSQQQFGLQSQSQEFGTKVMYNTQVDVLWVIDTSSSMDKYQNLLAPQMGLFVDALNQTGLDYHMAVTTMDMSGSGEDGKFVAQTGTPLVLSNSTPNFTNILSQRIQLGGNGSPVERGEEAMKAALSSPLVTGYNNGFLRAGAMLVVVFLSNEDDSSATANYSGFLDTLRPPINGQRSWLAQFMGVTSDDPTCQTSAWTSAGYSEVGTKYMSLASSSGGTSQSICSLDLRTALTNVKARILEVITQYTLNQAPDIASIVVHENGTLVPQDATNGWTYDSTSNSIRFHGTYVPNVDASVKVDYQPAGIK